MLLQLWVSNPAADTNIMSKQLSKRKLESYSRAEMVAQECRYQFADNRRMDLRAISELVVYWMESTGKKIVYKRPSKSKI